MHSNNTTPIWANNAFLIYVGDVLKEFITSMNRIILDIGINLHS